MDTKELNEYIKNYLEHDKTQRAIIITAPWGSGKSYYIKEKLCPFLDDNGIDYALVSLYGLKDLKELSKNLYIEIRASIFNKKSEKVSAVKIIGKTIFKGIASFFGIDLSQNHDDWQKLYESIDLTNKLIIFEDLERSGIDIIEFMGYVNNLVEQDEVKILIIANENEIIQYESVTNNGKTEMLLTDKSKEYLKIKEKTISDTINFSSDYYESIKSILEKFDNKYFKLMLQEKDENGDISLVRKIKQQMIDENCINYRSLLFACQKTEDMLKLLDEKKECNLEFIENLFIGTIIYSIKFNNGQDELWKDFSYTSSTLGNYAYPLYRIMYDFIKTQSFLIEDFDNMMELFIKTKDISKADEILQVIYHYYEMSEKEVKEAIDVVCERLQKDEGIDYNEYVCIANYLIAIKSTLKYERIDESLNYMLENTKNAVNQGKEIQIYSSRGIQLSSQEEVDAFEKFKLDMLKIVNDQKNKLISFNYEPKALSDYYDWITAKKITFINEKGFANKLDIEKTIDMLKNCSAIQIEDFRRILQYIYMGISNIAEYMYDDIENLKTLKVGVDEIVDKLDKIDAIQKLQFKWLSGSLDTIINKLQGGQNAEIE